MTSTPLSVTAFAHLRKASVHPSGHLPIGVGRTLLTLFVENKYVYREDADGYVLKGDDALQDLKTSALEARPFIIRTAGRRAALNDGQLRALIERVGPDGRLARTVAWPTARTLARLLLVELRDEQGNPAPGDGIPFRTELGKTVAEETPTGDCIIGFIDVALWGEVRTSRLRLHSGRVRPDPSKAAASTTERKTMPLPPTAPFTDANTLEDSALLAALGNSRGNVHAPDGARLVAIGLATVNDRGHYFLTEDGHAVAQGLRRRERLLISDEALKVIGNGRAHGKATGWIAGAVSSRRAYVEMVRLPHTSPETFDDLVTRGTWYGLQFQLYSRLGIHAEREGARLYLGYASTSGAFRAAEHADDVWNDLCRDHRVHGIHAPGTVYTAPTGLLFHYESRHVLLSRDEHGRARAEITNGPDVGRSWTGHRADIAVKAMCSSLYGNQCTHGCVTGRDSCPGCDATAEDFENTYGPLIGPMPTAPLA